MVCCLSATYHANPGLYIIDHVVYCGVLVAVLVQDQYCKMTSRCYSGTTAELLGHYQVRDPLILCRTSGILGTRFVIVHKFLIDTNCYIRVLLSQPCLNLAFY